MAKKKEKGLCKACLQAEIDIENIEAELAEARDSIARLRATESQEMHEMREQLTECRRLLREDLQGIGHSPGWWSRVEKILADEAAKAGGCE